MKNILKGIVIFAVCLTISACGTSSPQDITIQSITEPMTTMQTVRQVPETEVVAENTDNWTEPAATEVPDDTYNNGAETLAGMTFPEEIDDWIHAYIIRDLFYQGPPVYYLSKYGTGFSDYDDCYECYKKLLVEKFLDYPDNFNLFGGAYWCDGWLFLRITDYSKKDDIFSDFFDDLESVEITSCKYSYSYLVDVMGVARQNEKATGDFINLESNCVEIYGVFTDEDKENIFAALEAAGLDPEAVEIMVVDENPVVNPC